MEKCVGEMDSAALRDLKHALAGPPGRADDLYKVATSCRKSQKILIQAYSKGDPSDIGFFRQHLRWVFFSLATPGTGIHQQSIGTRMSLINSVWVFFSASTGTANLSSPLRKWASSPSPTI